MIQTLSRWCQGASSKLAPFLNPRLNRPPADPAHLVGRPPDFPPRAVTMCTPRPLLPLLLCAGLAGSALASSRPQRYEPADLSRQLLEGTPYADATPSTFEFEAFLDTEFLALPIGLYDVRMPAASLETQTAARQCQDACIAFADMQVAFLRWLEETENFDEELLEDATLLRDWIADWRFSELVDIAGDDSRSRTLLESLGADEEVRAAAEHLRESMLSGEALGLSREDAQDEPLILAPTRNDFLSLCAFGGWLWPSAQNVFWDPAVTTWTHCTIDRYAVLALEYADVGTQAGIIAGGLSMDYRYDTGLEQQVGQLAAAALISNYYEGKLPGSIRDGLAVNMVIDVYDVCDTRVDGDLRARETQAVEIFVPGGNPDGGILPKVDANSRWRQSRGEDRFVGILKNALEAGADLAKRDRSLDRKIGRDKLQHFALKGEMTAQETFVTGPQLGSAGAETVLPGETFHGDYLEFLRAYQTCFLHWLRTESEGSRKSAEHFGELLKATAAMDGVQQLEDVLAEQFDVDALSTVELDKRKDLEGRFRYWLSRQRG